VLDPAQLTPHMCLYQTAIIPKFNARYDLMESARLQSDPRTDSQILASSSLTRLDVDEVAAVEGGELVARQVEKANYWTR
jgi:hypothetical protein